MKTVAVVGSSLDEHARYVADACVACGADVVLVYSDRFPDDATFSWEDGVARWCGRSLHDVRAFYVKSVHLSLPAVDPAELGSRNFSSWPERYAAERERHSLLTAALRSLESPERVFVNPLRSFDLHFLKLHQIELLRRANVPVPATLGTNEPAAVRAFADKHHSVIFKPLSGGALARRLTAEDLDDRRLELLGNCPTLFQEEIPGVEFRAYVLDGKPLKAFEIPTEGVVDARQALDKARPSELPDEGWRVCIEGARALGLVFTAADLRRTPDGRFVLLECNPTPAVSFYEDPRKGTVVQALARYLVERA